jgi:hypothetical protein
MAEAGLFSAKHYEKFADLRITQEAAIHLRDTHIDADYWRLQLIYPQFDTLPDAENWHCLT